MQKNKIYIYMLIAYIFSFAFHLFWITWASHNPEFYWHGQLMINNPDGYNYASDAQKILYGMHKYNLRLSHPYGIGMGLGVITAFISKLFPFLSLDTIILYLSAVISSLIVIPIILIGKLYKNLEWGFLSALLASIAWSFYNRTLIGYYDTDMFSVLNITIVLYLFLYSIKKDNIKSLFFAFLMILFNEWVYPSGNTIIFVVFILSLIYLFFTNKELMYKFMLIISVAFIQVNILLKLLIGIAIFYLIYNKKVKNEKLISWIVFLISLIFSKVMIHLFGEIIAYSRPHIKQKGLHFLNVIKTVREASHIPYYIIADRIIGSLIGLVLSFLGYILLVKKHKEFIIALPMWGVGLFAFFGGLRFTVHAVPIAALSAVFFLFYIGNKLKEVKPIIIGFGFIVLITPNITHIIGCCQNNKIVEKIENSYIKKFGIKIKLKEIYPLRSYPYLVPTVLNKSEVAVLDKLKDIASEKDYGITWWDYGYPIWYYSDINTLIDGGKHQQDNYIVSKILTTSNPKLAYNLGKLSVKKYIEINLNKDDGKKPAALALFMKNKKPINVSYLLETLNEKNLKNLNLNRNLYLILPYRMFNIFPTIAAFSNRNLNTGQIYPPNFYYQGRVRYINNVILVGEFPIDIKRGLFKVNDKFIPLKEIDLVEYDKHMKLKVKKQKIRENGLNLVVLKSYGNAFLVDDYYYNSIFFQMFVFENYDKNLFEPVILNPLIKIYKYK